MVVISRREVVLSVPATAVAVALPAGAAAAAKSQADLFSRSRWAAVVGSRLTATSATSTLSVTLTAVEDLLGSPGSDRRYALRFTSTTTAAEGTYSLGRPGFTATPVHLVPGSSRSVTAVVNRL